VGASLKIAVFFLDLILIIAGFGPFLFHWSPLISVKCFGPSCYNSDVLLAIFSSFSCNIAQKTRTRFVSLS